MFHPGGIGDDVFFMVSSKAHLLIHQLRQILVAADDQHRPAVRGRLPGQGADHIVSFHARNLQQRQAQRLNKGMKRRNLLNQFRIQRRTVGLVSGKQFMAEGLAGRVEMTAR